MKTTLFLFVLLVPFCTTAQTSDNLSYRGQRIELYSKPLEQYFQQHPQKKPYERVPYSYSSYTANFEITADILLLKDIFVSKDSTDERNHSHSVFKEIFGDVSVLDCDFYTGLLILPHGEPGNIVSEDFYYSEQYELLEIRHGKVVKSKIVDRREYLELQRLQFGAYHKTEDYKKQLAFHQQRRMDLLKERGKSVAPGKKAGSLTEKENASREEKHLQEMIRLFPWYYNWIIPAEF